MAVYVICLRRLRKLSARRSLGQPPPEALRTKPPTIRKAAPEEGTAKNPVDVPAGDIAQVARAGAGVVGASGTPASSPKSQINVQPLEWGESGGKALLALLYRLGSIEAQLADLTAHVRGVSVPASVCKKPDHSHQETGNASKSELLEQVFRENLLLRRKA